MKRTNFFVLLAILILLFGMAVAVGFARGYRFDPTTKEVLPTGILVATSDPDGAEVRINGILKSATNTTLNLAPGKYTVRIEKDGFFPWEKQIEIKKEEVLKTNVFLFPRIPDLRPLTLTGALNPTISPDQTKILYGVASGSAEKQGLWIADLGRSSLSLPILSQADFRQIYHDVPNLKLSTNKFVWSYDSKQVLAYDGKQPPSLSTPSATPVYLLNTDQGFDTPQLVNPTLTKLLTQWTESQTTRQTVQVGKIDPKIQTFLATTSAQLNFSPDESKIMYVATASATMPTFLTTYLPGSDPTLQSRTLTPKQTYVYDLKEDRNYLIASCSNPAVSCSWYPSSRHILATTDHDISVMEYDGSNLATVYAGPFISKVVYPWPNWTKIVILTSLNQGVGENLYTINLR